MRIIMKKYWIALTFAVAILCLSLTGKIFTIGYYWEVPAIPTVLLWIAAVLGIPSSVLLLFYILRFLICSVLHPTYKVTFVSILWLGIIVIVLMCLYPPWIQTVRLRGSNIKGTNPQGYSFLWHPPDKQFTNSGIAIDYSRLLLQILVVGLITGGLLLTLWLCQSKMR